MGLWKSYLLALERHGADHQTVSGYNECSMKLFRLSLSYNMLCNLCNFNVRFAELDPYILLEWDMNMQKMKYTRESYSFKKTIQKISLSYGGRGNI